MSLDDDLDMQDAEEVEEAEEEEAGAPEEAPPKPKAKKRASKPKPRRKADPDDGGTGKRIKSVEDLSTDERRVLEALAEGRGTIAEVAARYRRLGTNPKGDEPHGGPISAYRRVLNALRRPRARGFIRQVGRGTYEATAAGRKLLQAP